MTSVWGTGDVVRWAAASAAGVVLAVVGWVMLSGHAGLSGEIPGLNLALVGLIVFGVAQAGWLLTGSRRVDARAGALDVSPRAPRRAPRPATADPVEVAVAGLHHFHRPDCAFAAGRTTTARPRDAHLKAGLAPCPACRP